MAKKTSDFTKAGIEGLAKDKPVVYDIKNNAGKSVYIGSSKKGQTGSRIKDHLPGGSDPIKGGSKVSIKQYGSISDAQKAELRAIKTNQPPQNKKTSAKTGKISRTKARSVVTSVIKLRKK